MARGAERRAGEEFSADVIVERDLDQRGSLAMKWTRNHDRSGAALRLRSKLGALVFLGAVLMAAQQGQQAASPPLAVPAAQGQSQNPDPGNAQQKKQIAEESARLLALATDLKTEVDKSNKDTLSLTVVRKAGEIERLAHSVKERMKLASLDH